MKLTAYALAIALVPIVVRGRVKHQTMEDLEHADEYDPYLTKDVDGHYPYLTKDDEEPNNRALVPAFLFDKPNPSSAESSAPAVTFCEHYGCNSGFKWEQDGPMESVWVGAKNDKISEIVIQKGWKLQIFQHSNFGGRSKVFEAQDSAQAIHLGRHNMNDEISSFKIFKLNPTIDTSNPTSAPTFDEKATAAPTSDEKDFDFVEEVPNMSQGDIVKVMNWIKAEVTMVKNPFCWRNSYGRGVGKPLHDCARQGKVKIGALCYSHCPAGMKRVGFDCHSKCPSGTRDDGLFCRWTEYGRGSGYAWKPKDGFSDRGMYKRCERRHGKGKCQKHGAIVYPKCRSGYRPVGCCICRPNPPNCSAHNLGGRFDLSCAKKVRIGDPTPMQCSADEDEDAGLCYKKCRNGYNGIGPVCWGYCDDSQVDCGLACAKSQDQCMEGIEEQIVGPLILAANVATLGLATPATAGTRMTIKIAGKVVAGNTRLGKFFVWAVKSLQKTGKMKKVDGKEQFVLDGWKENGIKVLKKIMDPTENNLEETVETMYVITDIVEGNTGTNEAKESYQSMRDYRMAFADEFAEQTSADINSELDRNFHPSTARFLKETWAEYSLAEMAEAEGWETADTVLDTAALVDITGVMGVVDAYAKPTCNENVPFPSTAANLRD